MTSPTTRCAECRQPGWAARRCPDCRAPVHQRCQAGHACPPRRARVAALNAAAEARLVPYRVALALEVDSARGSPASWDWPSRLGLRPPERVLAEVTRAREAAGDPDGSAGVIP
jgi:hypothetical protein